MAAAPQTVAALGRAIKTEPRCRICKSNWRGAVEDALVLRSRREKDPVTGVRISEREVMRRAAELWDLPNLTHRTLTIHFARHFQAVDPGVAAVVRRDEGLANVGDRLRNGELPHVEHQDYLQLLVNIGAARAAADPESVTNDQSLKAAAELGKRKADSGTAALMVALAGATAKALTGVPSSQPVADLEATAEEVLEARDELEREQA